MKIAKNNWFFWDFMYDLVKSTSWLSLAHGLATGREVLQDTGSLRQDDCQPAEREYPAQIGRVDLPVTDRKH